MNRFQEMLMIFIIVKNILPVDSPQDNVVNTAIGALSCLSHMLLLQLFFSIISDEKQKKPTKRTSLCWPLLALCFYIFGAAGGT